MTPDQEIAELCDEWPHWHIWRGRDHNGHPEGWHATLKQGAKAVIVAANGPAELRQRLRDAGAPLAGVRS